LTHFGFRGVIFDPDM